MHRYSKRMLNNQAIGLIPLLTAMVVDTYFPYTVAFFTGILLCLLGFLLLYIFRKENVYQFLLIPTTAALILYSVFFLFDLQLVLYNFSILLVEILLVVILAFIRFFKRPLLSKIRHSKFPAHKRTILRTKLNEAYLIAQITQNLYTLHLFFILIYIHLPEPIRRAGVEHFLYQYAGSIIGLFIIAYGQVRTQLMYGHLRKEVWLPVLNDKGHVIGSMARSISRSSDKKYYHPIIRIAVIYNGMLYLKKRKNDEYISPELLDYPLQRDVRYRQSIDSALHETLGTLQKDKSIQPRFMIRYTFENDYAKHLVHLYTICLRTEEQLKSFTEGKLWTPKQIGGNMGTGIFSAYFEKEFPYLQSTILLAENLSYGNSAENNTL